MSQSLLDPSDKSQSYPAKPGHSSKRRILLPLGFGLAIAGTALGIWYVLSRPTDKTLHLSGRLEGYETDIGAKIGGRVSEITVREGDQVKQGQVIAQLNDEDVQAQLRGAAAKVEAARQQAQQAQLQISVVDSQIREAQLNLLQSQQDNQGRVYQAQSNVVALEAQLKQYTSQLKLAQLNRDRYAQLWQQGAAKKLDYDQAQTTYETAAATLESVQKQIESAKGGLALAQSSGYNPYIRNAQLSELIQQRQRASAQLESAKADIKNAAATEQQIQAQLAYLKVVSPIDGVVTARSVEPGAVVVSGKTLLSVLDLRTVYLRGFIPEGKIGKIRVGQSANVFLDAKPKEALPAKVAAIDPQASFTPENIYFRDERVRQVFGIKLMIENPKGLAKPGMPADAEIVLE
jgi:HlyD family secretion protein